MCTRTSTLSARSTLPEANFGARRYGNANGIASTAVILTAPANVSAAPTVAGSVRNCICSRSPLVPGHNRTDLAQNVSQTDGPGNTNMVLINYVLDMNRPG